MTDYTIWTLNYQATIIKTAQNKILLLCMHYYNGKDSSDMHILDILEALRL